MSEREEVENAPALEDIFLSREFGSHDTRHAPGPHREFERAHTAKQSAAVALEDLFRGQEFGKTAAVAPANAPDVLFAPAPPRPLTPLSPLVARTGHDTTTHRRNRFVATASGVAAALLVAIGLATNTGKSPSNAGTVAIGGKTVPQSPQSPLTKTPGFVTPPIGGGVPTAFASATGATGIRTAAKTFGGSIGGGSTSGSTGGTKGGGSGGSGGSSGGGGGTGTTPPTSSSGSILTPVVSIVGHVVVSTGAIVTAASSGLGNTVPPITPVTNVLGGLGGTVAGLGWGIVKLA
jgi:hypothetical protein